MSIAAFDTLSVARDLEAAGFERRQAEAVASAIGHSDERVATKADLEATKADLEAAMAQLEAAMAWLETRLTNRLYAVVIGAVFANGLIAAALRLL